jgi:hypothetical protein
MSFLPLYVYFIFISFLASLSVYINSTAAYPYLKLFPPFLLTTIIVESIGSYIGSIRMSNLTLYNFFTVFEFCFYLYVIRLIINSKQMRKVFVIAIIAYGTLAVVNIIFIQKMKAFHTMSYALGCLLIVTACVYYFFELFKIPKAVKLINNPAFWICSGLLFFYCCGFPLYGMFNFLSGISRLIIRNFFSIIVILNIFLYSLFTIAFLCRLKIRKYILSR